MELGNDSNTSHLHMQAACSCSGWPGLASVSTVLAPAAQPLNSRVWACLDHRSFSRSPSFPHPPPLFNPGNHILRGNTDWKWNGPDVKREERLWVEPMSSVSWEFGNASTDTLIFHMAQCLTYSTYNVNKKPWLIFMFNQHLHFNGPNIVIKAQQFND